MAITENRVQFGLKNVHYAVLNESSNTYSTPAPIPGAVNLSLSAEGDMQKFYADNIAYFTTNTNNGYSGDLEVAKIPEQMMQDVFGFILDSTDKTLMENADAQAVPFALLFQIDGDQNNSLFCMYSCTATRPGLDASTKQDTTEPKTQTVTLSAVPTADGKVYARTTKDSPSSVVDNWFQSVYIK